MACCQCSHLSLFASVLALPKLLMRHRLIWLYVSTWNSSLNLQLLVG